MSFVNCTVRDKSYAHILRHVPLHSAGWMHSQHLGSMHRIVAQVFESRSNWHQLIKSFNSNLGSGGTLILTEEQKLGVELTLMLCELNNFSVLGTFS